MEVFLEDKTPPVEDLRAALRRATLAGKVVPVAAASAFKNKGVQPLLDAITYYVRMGTQPVYFQIYMVKVSFPPGAPMRPWQPVGLQDPWLQGNRGPGCKS